MPIGITGAVPLINFLITRCCIDGTDTWYLFSLQKATAGTLALLGDDDYPYAVPISYVYHDGRLYFHSALTGHKVDAIHKCDKASFCVIEQVDVQPEKYTNKFGRSNILKSS